jgi:glycosyltransferase involved in cell wall biosynthesis
MVRTVGVVVPAYKPDVSLLREYVRALRRELDPKIIRVELDAPDPDTEVALEALDATVNAVPERRGKGAAITDGFDALETDVLAFADADGSTPAESIAGVVDAIRSGRTDLAVGSRRHPDAEVRSHQTVLRQHLGDVFAWLARRFHPVELRDYQCGAKAMTRDVWQSIRGSVTEPGFAWDIEVLAIAGVLGYEIEEVPVIWEDHPDSTVATSQAVPELLRALRSVRKRIRTVDRDANGDRTVGPTDAEPLVERER